MANQGKPPEHRLPQHTDQSVPVLAPPRVGEPIASRLRKAESIVKLAIGKQPSIGGDDRTAKLEHQPAVEIEPQSRAVRTAELDAAGASGRKSLAGPPGDCFALLLVPSTRTGFDRRKDGHAITCGVGCASNFKEVDVRASDTCEAVCDAAPLCRARSTLR
jgi:hypothetical protein